VDTLLLRVHQQQIEHQCKAAIMALKLAQAALDRNDQDVFWASIQNALTASGNIAKGLWGAGGKLAAEREPLRRSLGISDDDNPLASVDLRNHLEHYDERLDRWYRTSARHIHADFIIGPVATTIGGADSGDVFRHFDPQTGDVIFWGEHYSILALRDALHALLPIVEAEAAKPPWEIPPGTAPSPSAPFDIRKMRCGTCGNLTPQCTCLDIYGNPLTWE
jgi:hypothetical protein